MARKPGSVQAILARITRLSPVGIPIVGEDNCFYSDSLIEASWQPTYSEPDPIQQDNGAGATHVFWQPDPSVQGLSIEGIKWCTPDPEIMEFLGGGTVLTTGTGDSRMAIGYAAPEVGSPASKYPVSLELWTRAVLNGVHVGYYHHLMSNLRLKFSENWVANGSDALVPEFAGTGSENRNWKKGPKNDWPYSISHRVFQTVLEEDLPDDYLALDEDERYGYTDVLEPAA